jgi:hypothetical protein
VSKRRTSDPGDEPIVLRPVSGVMTTMERDGLLLSNVPVFALNLRGHPEIADLTRVVILGQGGKTTFEWTRDGEVVRLQCQVTSPVRTAMVIEIPMTAREALEGAAKRGLIGLGPDPLPYIAPGKLGAVLHIDFDPAGLRLLLAEWLRGDV